MGEDPSWVIRPKEKAVSNAARTGQLQTVHRALDLLEALADEQQDLPLGALAERLGLSRSTTHRLLSTLVSRGYAIQATQTGHYRIGVRAYQIGSAFLDHNQLRDVARPIMRALLGKVDETVNLAVIDDDEAVYVDNIDSTQAVRTFARIGTRAPLHATGVGKALLAGENPQRVRYIARRRGLPRFTPNTLTRVEELLVELARIRHSGYALDREEYERSVRCAAAPVWDHTGRVIAALSASGPAYRIDDHRLFGMAIHVRSAALELSGLLGYL